MIYCIFVHFLRGICCNFCRVLPVVCLALALSCVYHSLLIIVAALAAPLSLSRLMHAILVIGPRVIAYAALSRSTASYDSALRSPAPVSAYAHFCSPHTSVGRSMGVANLRRRTTKSEEHTLETDRPVSYQKANRRPGKAKQHATARGESEKRRRARRCQGPSHRERARGCAMREEAPLHGLPAL
jgi:hypothetical protein